VSHSLAERQPPQFQMEPSIIQNLDQIADLCRRFHVRRLELFGSAVGARFDRARSDVDFLVEFQPLAAGEHADSYFGLRESLSSLLSRPVDLVMVRAIRNRYFLEAIQPTRTLLYAA
jgi:predicted nucleotidyltransferase